MEKWTDEHNIFIFHVTELQGCNEVQVSYYDNDSCGLIPVEGNIIYVTQSRYKLIL